MYRTWEMLFETGRVLRRSLREQQACIRDVYARLAPHLATPDGTPAEYAVQPGAVPPAFYGWRKNLFSTLFHSAYHLMGVAEPRRMLYGKLIHLFRIWVTSADNLLDREDKVVVPVDMPGASRIMRQVVAVMAADRVLAEVLAEAAAAGVLNADEGARLARESLRRLLPSAAQEATEEGGVRERPPPGHVLEVIHRLKTGLLFNVAFLGPDILEPDLAPGRRQGLKDALMQFGLGCQLLDDVRDMARDLLEGRHNYVLSALAHSDPASLEALRAKAVTPADRLYFQAPQAALPAARRGLGLMRDSLRTLGEAGLGFGPAQADSMARSMLAILDLEGFQRV